MTIRKILTSNLQKCLDAGLGVSETARQLGVTRGAVSKRFKALRKTLNYETSKEVVLFHAGDIVTKEINAVDQLHKINVYANELLDLLMRWNRGDDEALQILESQIIHKQIRIGKKIEFIKDYKMRDPKELALKAMGEIRGQIQLQFEIFSKLYDMESVAKFQEAILTTIGEVEPDVRKRIIEKLRDRRILRSAVKCD
jgi:hypothetical protein